MIGECSKTARDIIEGRSGENESDFKKIQDEINRSNGLMPEQDLNFLRKFAKTQMFVTFFERLLK